MKKQTQIPKLTDAHAHLGSNKEQELRKQYKIESLICGSYPRECQKLNQLSKTNPYLIPTYGLHPWYSNQYTLDAMMPYIQKASIIGEIGMDSVWCQVPLSIQKKQFVTQLEFAKTHKIPIILHTKGQEKEILDIIQTFSYPIIIHWYSCDNYLEGYLEKDYYFTIGPDVKTNPIVQQIIKKAPLNRLLVETDGFAAVLWAQKKELSLNELPNILYESIEYIAGTKNKSIEEVATTIENNFNFIKNFKERSV